MRISRALHLRGLGFTHAEIGDEEGYGESTACRLVKEGMACLTGRPAKELLAAELSFINALKEAVVNKKLDLRQVDRLIRLHERTSKLLGLEAPTRSRSRCSSG